MNRRDIVVGAIIIVILGGLVWYFRGRGQEPEMVVPDTLSVQSELEDKFGLQIPEDAEKAELKAQGDTQGTAIASRREEGGVLAISLLADLPDPEAGSFYQAWISKGEEGADGFERTSVGRLTIAKGGYLLDYEGSKDLSQFNKVTVTLERSADNTPEELVLEGTF